ncbi:MAG: PP2C family protein-serine/threonine phosphatase [Acidimicrobiales bacterium]
MTGQVGDPLIGSPRVSGLGHRRRERAPLRGPTHYRGHPSTQPPSRRASLGRRRARRGAIPARRSEVEVGGDWYDIAELPDGTVLLVMGDVVGRGVPAASLMGQLRDALRAYAFDAHPPAAIATKLNRLLCTMAVDRFATVVIGLFDATTSTLRIANAGHPPPLILRDGHEPQFLGDAAAPPVGAIRAAQFHETEIMLEPGSALVLYTDGLVEDRTLPLSEGLARLRRCAARASDDSEAACDDIVAGCVVGRAADDDIAILVLRHVGSAPEVVDRARDRSDHHHAGAVVSAGGARRRRRVATAVLLAG